MNLGVLFLTTSFLFTCLGCGTTQPGSERLNLSEETIAQVKKRNEIAPPTTVSQDEGPLKKLSLELLDNSKKKIGIVIFEENRRGINFSFESDLLKKGNYELFVRDNCDAPKANDSREAIAAFSSEEGGQYYTEHSKENLFLSRDGKDNINGKFLLFVRKNATGKFKYTLLGCAKIQL